MKFICENCKAKYQIGDDKIAGRQVRMKCRRCGHLIQLSASVTDSSVGSGEAGSELVDSFVESASSTGISVAALLGGALPSQGALSSHDSIDDDATRVVEAPHRAGAMPAPRTGIAPAVPRVGAGVGSGVGAGAARPGVGAGAAATGVGAGAAGSGAGVAGSGAGAAASGAGAGAVGSGIGAARPGMGAGAAASGVGAGAARPGGAPSAAGAGARPGAVAPVGARPVGSGGVAGAFQKSVGAAPGATGAAATGSGAGAPGASAAGATAVSATAASAAAVSAAAASAAAPGAGDTKTPAASAARVAHGEDWYVGVGGVPLGPVRLAVIREKALAGAVHGDSLVWREGFDEWQPLKKFPELLEIVEEAQATRGGGARRPSQMPPRAPGPAAAGAPSAAPKPASAGVTAASPFAAKAPAPAPFQPRATAIGVGIPAVSLPGKTPLASSARPASALGAKPATSSPHAPAAPHIQAASGLTPHAAGHAGAAPGLGSGAPLTHAGAAFAPASSAALGHAGAATALAPNAPLAHAAPGSTFGARAPLAPAAPIVARAGAPAEATRPSTSYGRESPGGSTATGPGAALAPSPSSPPVAPSLAAQTLASPLAMPVHASPAHASPAHASALPGAPGAAPRASGSDALFGAGAAGASGSDGLFGAAGASGSEASFGAAGGAARAAGSDALFGAGAAGSEGLFGGGLQAEGSGAEGAPSSVAPSSFSVGAVASGPVAGSALDVMRDPFAVPPSGAALGSAAAPLPIAPRTSVPSPAPLSEPPASLAEDRSRRRGGMHPVAYAFIAMAAAFGAVVAYMLFSRPPQVVVVAPPPVPGAVAVAPGTSGEGVATGSTAVAEVPSADPSSTQARVAGTAVGTGAKTTATAAPTGTSAPLDTSGFTSGVVPLPTAPSTVTGPDPSLGQLSAGEIQGVVASNQPRVRKRCWQPALDSAAAGASPNARVNGKITIGASGAVESASASGAEKDYPGLSSCVAGQMKSWRFPPSSGSTPVNVPYVFAGQ